MGGWSPPFAHSGWWWWWWCWWWTDAHIRLFRLVPVFGSTDNTLCFTNHDARSSHLMLLNRDDVVLYGAVVSGVLSQDFSLSSRRRSSLKHSSPPLEDKTCILFSKHKADRRIRSYLLCPFATVDGETRFDRNLVLLRCNTLERHVPVQLGKELAVD